MIVGLTASTCYYESRRHITVFRACFWKWTYKEEEAWDDKGGGDRHKKKKPHCGVGVDGATRERTNRDCDWSVKK